MTLSFFVPGIPISQGSKRAFVVRTKDGRHRPVLAESAKELGEWRSRVALAARQAMRKQFPSGDWWWKKEPLNLTARFIFPRPPSIPKRRKEHVVRPDADKCCRAILDAMTGIIFGDDAQVVNLGISKIYAKNGLAPGVEIEVWEAE